MRLLPVAALTFATVVSAGALPKSIVPLTTLDALVVNTDANRRTVVHQSEEAGAEQIRALVQREDLEEAWAYVPDRQLWVEIGTQETPVHDVGPYRAQTLTIDERYFNGLLRSQERLVLYHFHPVRPHRIQDIIADRAAEGTPYTPEELLTLASGMTLKQALPSFYDLAHMVHYSTEFSRRHPEGELTYKISSIAGVTSFSLTAEGVAHFRDMGKKEIVAYAFDHLQTAPDAEAGVPHSIIIACASLSNSWLRLTFAPYREFRQQPLNTIELQGVR